MFTRLLFICLSLSACLGTDLDQDGVPNEEDCDDRDPEIWPGAVEVCDGVDNDCDGLLDADDPDTLGLVQVFEDADSDGYGTLSGYRWKCPAVDQVWRAGDCDDADPDRHPEIAEACDDGVDNNCDGRIDEWPACGDPYGLEFDITVRWADSADDCDVPVFAGSSAARCDLMVEWGTEATGCTSAVVLNENLAQFEETCTFEVWPETTFEVQVFDDDVLGRERLLAQTYSGQALIELLEQNADREVFVLGGGSSRVALRILTSD